MHCVNHPHVEAEGVCIICCKAYCGNCLNRVIRLYLCDRHRDYEIYEGMARVFGGSDIAQTEFAKSCLEQAGLHPFLYSRKASTYSLGGPEYSLFRASGEYDGHIINEVKVMVPVQEVARAERALGDVELTGTAAMN